MFFNNVILPTGAITSGTDIQRGDRILAYDSSSAYVKNVEICEGTEIYKISTSKSKIPLYVCDSSKVLIDKESDFIDVDANILSSLSHSKLLSRKYRLPFSNAVEFSANNELPMEPYMFGLLLFNSSCTASLIRMAISKQLLPMVDEYLDSQGLKKRKMIPDNDASNSYFLTNNEENKGRRIPIFEVFESLNLAGVMVKDRFIPEIYKTSSVNNRLALLAAICDSSAYVNQNSYQFTTASLQIAKDICFIAKSVGLIANYSPSKKNGKQYYFASIKGNTAEIPCLIKKPKCPQRIDTSNSFTPSIESIGKGDFLFIETDRPYLTEDFVVAI